MSSNVIGQQDGQGKFKFTNIDNQYGGKTTDLMTLEEGKVTMHVPVEGISSGGGVPTVVFEKLDAPVTVYNNSSPVTIFSKTVVCSGETKFLLTLAPKCTSTLTSAGMSFVEFSVLGSSITCGGYAPAFEGVFGAGCLQTLVTLADGENTVEVTATVYPSSSNFSVLEGTSLSLLVVNEQV